MSSTRKIFGKKRRANVHKPTSARITTGPSKTKTKKTTKVLKTLRVVS